MLSRIQRRRTILALVGSQRIRSQTQLQSLLADQGQDVNQATLSRDLRDLGVRKGPGGYELPDAPAPETDAAVGRGLAHHVAEWLLEAVPASNQVVLRTPPGGAAPLAFALDHARLSEIIGTLAGDDTILAVCKDEGDAIRLATRLRQLQTERQRP